MKILYVSPSFAPAWRYGGPIRSVFRLCSELAQQGCQVRVLTTDANGPDAVLDVETRREVEGQGFRVRYCHRIAGHSVSPTLLRILPTYIRWADLIHLTAVYNFPTIPTLLICRLLGKPLVWSPRGALQRWAGSRRRHLKAIWEAICRTVAPKYLVFHATSEQEAVESQERFPRFRFFVIPNGVDIPSEVFYFPSNGVLRLLYLGRLDPKKGIENLLEACARLNQKAELPWTLTIAGGGNPSYISVLQAKVNALGLQGQVRMTGEVQDETKGALFAHADLVVVPSHTENFGLVVAEALAHGVPVIASRGTPWRRVEEVGCGLWVDNEPESLAQAVEQMSRMPLREMGERGREWMKREFAWPIIAKQMLCLYERMINVL